MICQRILCASDQPHLFHSGSDLIHIFIKSLIYQLTDFLCRTTASVENATDKAKIKDSDAINFIKTSYTKNELGLDKVKEKYDFMISQNGVKIGKKQYVKVAANIMKKNDTTSKDGKQTYSLTPVGEYYISFDGDEVLMKDLKSGKYKKLENRYQDYSAKGQTAQSTTK